MNKRTLIFDDVSIIALVSCRYIITYNLCLLDTVCDTEFATAMTFKVVTSIFNFYIPTACMVFLNIRIFLAIKRRTKDIEQFGAYTATGGVSAKPAERKPKEESNNSPSVGPNTCGIKASTELPMANIAEAMHRAASFAGKRCSIRRSKRYKSSGPSL